MGIIFIIMELFCVIGILTNEISLGAIFIISLLITLYGLITMLQRKYLTNIGTIAMTISSTLLFYTVCELFLGVDIKTILGV